jgi:hypothetical protein
MKFFKWLPGRISGLEYYKLPIYKFKIFNFGFDCYILKYPKSKWILMSLPKHFDKVENGEHWRLNIQIFGDSMFYVINKNGNKKYYPQRFILFRPDIQEHGLEIYNRKDCVKLSFGFVKFLNSDHCKNL